MAGAGPEGGSGNEYPLSLGNLLGGVPTPAAAVAVAMAVLLFFRVEVDLPPLSEG